MVNNNNFEANVSYDNGRYVLIEYLFLIRHKYWKILLKKTQIEFSDSFFNYFKIVYAIVQIFFYYLKKKSDMDTSHM